MSTDRDFNYRTHCLERVKPLCLEAIKTMRDALDEAERDVNYEPNTPEHMIERTMQRSAWGWANASTSLSSALSALADARKVAEADAETAGAT